MTRTGKFAALGFAAIATLVASAESASAQYYGPGYRPYRVARPYRPYRPGVGIAAGVLGGLAAGAIIAGSTRPVYAAPVYGAPVYVDEPECFRRRVGHDGWGNPVFRTYCSR